ncbi:MAG: glucose/arabinose dehydrogenase [Cycloclasticus sp.]|jgi:glucose/arabinose dehydrogenase
MKFHHTGLLFFILISVFSGFIFLQKYSINHPFQFIKPFTKQHNLDHLTVADGFKLSIYADNIPKVRTMVISQTGDLIISQPKLGTLQLILKDDNNDGRSDGRLLLAQGLNGPYGLALHKGWLYIAETDSVLRIRYNAGQRKLIDTPRTIISHKFPGGGNHWSRNIKISPDGKLFVSVGSSCNACIENSPKRASILQYDLDGKNELIFATGLRNTVGFDWQPKTKLLFGVDNGRDYLGDDIPPEELNQINRGAHYGWPYEYGEKLVDSDYAKYRPAQLLTTPPIHQLTAHSAPLSLLFLKHNPKLYGTALVALHGSWNRSKKSGYKVVALSFSDDMKITQRDFISGFERNERVTGRPVDIAEDTDGSIYLSDDYNGRIFKASPIQ